MIKLTSRRKANTSIDLEDLPSQRTPSLIPFESLVDPFLYNRDFDANGFVHEHLKFSNDIHMMSQLGQNNYSIWPRLIT